MFTIYGGKAAFDQWDQGQRVTNPAMQAGDKVTFTNCTGETHPMKAYTHEGAVVCDVPNDLLMKAMPILVDLCGNHEHRTRLLVNAKEKPDGYVYVDNTAYPQESTGNSGGIRILEAGKVDNEFWTSETRDYTLNENKDEIFAMLEKGIFPIIMAPYPVGIGDGSFAEEWGMYAFAGTTNGSIKFTRSDITDGGRPCIDEISVDNNWVCGSMAYLTRD